MGPTPELMGRRPRRRLYSFTPTKDAQKQQFTVPNQSMKNSNHL